MTDFSDMTTVNKLQFLVDEYEKGSWRRYGQVQDACREAIVALEQAQADIQEQHDDLIEETLRANTAEARIEQLEAAIWKYWSDHGLVDGSNLQDLAKEMQKQLTAGDNGNG